jgi:hypothetical protein
VSLKDIRVPADTEDRQTTEAKSAQPPAEFTVTKGVTFNLLTIQDRQGVANRVPTIAYRAYFLPIGFLASQSGASPDKLLAAQKVANLVTEIAAPGRGTTLTFQDTTNFGQSGHYFCVGVNRSGVETSPQNLMAAP